jgi:hypothetical protein
MCEKCVEIDKRIERIKSIAARITDQQTIDGAAALVADLKAQKVTLHPERKREECQRSIDTSSTTGHILRAVTTFHNDPSAITGFALLTLIAAGDPLCQSRDTSSGLVHRC